MKDGKKTTEFWVVVVVQLLNVFKMFFPEANFDPEGQGTLAVNGLAVAYVLGRTIVKAFHDKYVGQEGAKAETLKAQRALLTPVKAIALMSLSVALLLGCGPKQPVSEGTIYVALEGTSAGYNFAHEAITKFSAIIAEQIKLSCPSDPGGPLCKAGKAYQKLYTESLYPASVEATAAWDKMMEAFDIYRNLDNPTQSDADDVIEKIEKVKALISKLKELFAGIKTTSGPISFEGIEMLDYTSRMLKYSEFQAQQIELEVQQ